MKATCRLASLCHLLQACGKHAAHPSPVSYTSPSSHLWRYYAGRYEDGGPTSWWITNLHLCCVRLAKQVRSTGWGGICHAVRCFARLRPRGLSSPEEKTGGVGSALIRRDVSKAFLFSSPHWTTASIKDSWESQARGCREIHNSSIRC